MTTVREHLTSQELAIALSRYDLGRVQEVRDFPKGSHTAAKVLITTDRGKYLLKRRPKGKDDPYKVAFAHATQNYLAERNFPLPHLIGTREGNNSMLRIGDAIYEMFEFIEGGPFDGGLLATYSAGKTLGLYHKLIRGYQPEWVPPTGSYHASKSVYESFPRIAEVLAPRCRDETARRQLAEVLDALRTAYLQAAEAADQRGLPNWETQIIHSDWHPGNMIFDQGHVVAVIDYDAARIGPPVVDIANGSLQYSFLAGGRDLSTWPDRTEETHVKRFLRGYDEINVISRGELGVVPFLMQEALIAQAIPPILKTGTFAGLDGADFLKVMLRKIRWLQKHGDRLNLDGDQKSESKES